MKNIYRMRCPNCGTRYESEKDIQEYGFVNCQTCNSSVKLVDEDPKGAISGALPPIQHLISISLLLLTSIIALFSPFFAYISIFLVFYLIIEIIATHRNNRKDRIELWNHINKFYLAYKDVNDKYKSISPELRGQIAADIADKRKLLDLLGDLSFLIDQKKQIAANIESLKIKLVALEEEEIYQSFGFYKPIYNCVDSIEYKRLMDEVRARQKDMVKNKEALRFSYEITKSNSSDDKAIKKNLEKLILRAFNGECDYIIDKVTMTNIDMIKNRIWKTFEDINELCKAMGISIAIKYCNLKNEELQLCYEYQGKLKEEKDKLKFEREEMKEKIRVAKELEEARKRVEKEEKHFNNMIEEIRHRMEIASAEEKRQYEIRLLEMENKLLAVKKDKEEVEYREKHTSAGYVYIISNIGSFGENVYKIGVTRRLDPQERIDELGDASVPFEFDVHAKIFSDNAFTLEKALHDHFADRAINKMNPKKEFFKTTLEEIKSVVHKNYDKIVDFSMMAPAEDYRMSIAKTERLKSSLMDPVARG